MASVSGGGLTWTRAAQANTNNASYGGAAEVWQAYATGTLNSATITATASVPGYPTSITVATFSAAASTVGATASGGAGSGAPGVNLTTTHAGSLVWGAGFDPTANIGRTPDAGQALAHQWQDGTDLTTAWAQDLTGSVPVAQTAISFGDSAPSSDAWNLVAVEVKPAGNWSSYTYDSRGNRVSITPPNAGTISLGYDQANRLTSYGTSAAYTYNADGLRMTKTISGVTSTFAWDQSAGMPLLLGDGTNSYIYGPDGAPIEQISISGGTVSWLHHDQVGSTRVLTDATGAVVGTYAFDPYGNQTAHTGSVSTPLGYAGEFTDAESGLVYLRARYYDPGTGQFLTRDPAVALTRSTYGYTDDDPLDNTDPMGLCSVNPFSNKSCLATAANYVEAHKTGILQTLAVGTFVVATVAAPEFVAAGSILEGTSASWFALGVTLDAMSAYSDKRPHRADRVTQTVGEDLLFAAVTGPLFKACRVPGPVRWGLGAAAAAVTSVVRPLYHAAVQ